MNRQHSWIPEPIAQLQRQLEQIRSTQPPRSRLPESVWAAAVELARQHGILSGRAFPPARLYGFEEAAERHDERTEEFNQNRLRGADAAFNDTGMRDRV